MKTILVLAALSICTTGHAAITASMDGGTSYIHLGRVSAQECRAVLASPVSASLKFAFDRRILVPDASLCHDGIQLDLVSEEAVVTATKDGVTTWPLAKDQCAVVATGVLKKQGTVRINEKPVTSPALVDAACSKSSNAVTAPL